MADLKLNDNLLIGDTSFSSMYTQLEYIENTGAQYICTGYYHNTYRTKYVFEVVPTGFNGYNAAFGARTAHNANDAYYLGWRSDSTTYGCIGGTKIDPLGWTIALNNHYTIIIDPNVGLIVNGTTYSNFKPSSNTDGVDPIDIFGFKQNGSDVEQMIGRIYYFKIYEDNSLHYDFVPAKRNSDNAIGLYDKISNSFFSNSGTGTFIAGPVIGPLNCNDGFNMIKSLAGNLKLVAYGQTDTVNAPKTTWGGRGLNAVTMSFDEEYIKRTAVNTNDFTIMKTGMYFIFWTSRLLNSGASAGVGLNINGTTQANDDRFCWGCGTTPRSMATGVQGEQYSAGTTISTTIYTDAAQRMNPIAMWIFVVT